MELKKELVTRVVNGERRYVFLCEFKDRNIAKDAEFRFDFNGARHWYTTDIAVAARLKNYARGHLRSELDQVQVKQRPRLTFENGLYVWRSQPHAQDIARRAGFDYQYLSETWTTKDPDRARRLIQFADDACKQYLQQVFDERRKAREASRAVDADIEVPAPRGLVYFGYQRAAVKVAVSQFTKNRQNGKPPGVLLGDDMGLGKTVEIIGTLNHISDYGKVLVLTPASLKVNWYRELTKWLVKPRKIMIADSRASRWKLDLAEIVIANYDILPRLLTLRKRAVAGRSAKEVTVLDLGKLDYNWDFLIADEAHLLKSRTTQRAQCAYALSERAHRLIYATGSPILNNVEEIYSLLHALDPESWPRHYRVPRLAEFQDKLRSSGILVRRLKSQVLTELPPKLRQIIEIDATDSAEVERAIAAERPAWERYEQQTERLRVAVELSKASDDPKDYERAVARLDEGISVGFEEMAAVRHQTALTKLPYVIGHLRELLDDNRDYKVVLMAWHQDVIERIAEAFGRRAAKVYGKVSSEVRMVGGQTTSARQLAVDRLQDDPDCQLLVCQIKAAGVGLNMTAASHVVFGELHWVPGEMTQAEDRLHRLGQKSNVLVQHVVLRGSLDARMARVLVAKQALIDQALDKASPGARLSITQPSDRAEGETEEIGASEAISRNVITSIASSLTSVQVSAIHEGLKKLCLMADSGAGLADLGVSQIDVGIGKRLATAGAISPREAALGKQIIARYRQQLPSDLLARIDSTLTA